MLGWLIDWTIVVVSAAIVREVFTSKRELPAHPTRIGARAAVAGAALPLAVPLWMAAELWWGGVQHARREYDRDTARSIIRFETAIIGAIAALYTLLPAWLLRRLWRNLSRRAAKIDPVDFERPKVHPAWGLPLLAACAAVAWFAGRSVYATIRNYRTCVRELGAGHTLRGVAMMTLLRFRQPRYEFFKITPVIADMFPLAICVVLYEIVPIRAFAAPLALLAASAEVAMSLDRVRPPTWFYLGTSEYEAFWVFDDLRHNWDLTALCLLDRGGEAGWKFYLAEQERWEKEGRGYARAFFNPRAPRIWNVRTRPDMWEHTVLLLIDYAPLIVIDLRQPSPNVLQEVRWLTEPSRISKTLFLYDEREGLLPEYAAIIPESARDRVLTGPQLYSYRSA
jgi:hypothetical protein